VFDLAFVTEDEDLLESVLLPLLLEPPRAEPPLLETRLFKPAGMEPLLVLEGAIGVKNFYCATLFECGSPRIARGRKTSDTD